MKIAADEKTSQLIADRAAQHAKAYGVKRGWSSTERLEPVFGEGYAGLRSPMKHLLFQERGTRSFLMTSLEGKIVPMPGGRFVRAVGVGQPGYVTLPGGVRKWRDQKWKHPGLKPTNFMRDSISDAINESRPEIRQMIVRQIMGGPS